MTESKRPSALVSMLRCKCPRCRKGDIFVGKALSKDYRKIHKECLVCNLHFELEVGFFWSAMYIGYAINVALCVTLGILTYFLLNNPDTWVYITVIVAAIILTSRFNFRYGRTILLYLFAPKYDDDHIEKKIISKSDPKLN